MNWDKVLRELHLSATDAQDRANRLALLKAPETEIAAANQTAEIIRVLLRVLLAGTR